MIKIFLFFWWAILGSFSPISYALPCALHDSKKCETKEGFKAELKESCATFTGNCRYRFCKYNCLDARADVNFCQYHCLLSPLLTRFKASNRLILYKVLLSYDRKNVQSVISSLKYEARVQKMTPPTAKDRALWDFLRTPQIMSMFNNGQFGGRSGDSVVDVFARLPLMVLP